MLHAPCNNDEENECVHMDKTSRGLWKDKKSCLVRWWDLNDFCFKISSNFAIQLLQSTIIALQTALINYAIAAKLSGCFYKQFKMRYIINTINIKQLQMRDIIEGTLEAPLRTAWFIPAGAEWETQKRQKDLVCKQVSLYPWFWICFSMHQRVNFVWVTKTCRSIKTQKHQDGFSLKCLNWKQSHWKSKLSKSSLCNLLIFITPFFSSFLHSLTYTLTQQILTEHLLCTKPCGRQHTGREMKTQVCPQKAQRA